MSLTNWFFRDDGRRKAYDCKSGYVIENFEVFKMIEAGWMALYVLPNP